jgi:hypothetical protein
MGSADVQQGGAVKHVCSLTHSHRHRFCRCTAVLLLHTTLPSEKSAFSAEKSKISRKISIFPEIAKKFLGPQPITQPTDRRATHYGLRD